MYIKKVEIKNIRSIEYFKMEFPEGEEAGWHVLIGDNGAGKSAILKAMAMGLIGPEDVLRLNPDWNSLVKRGKEYGVIRLDYIREEKELAAADFQKMNIQHIELNIGPDNEKKFKYRWEESPQTSHKGKRFSCGFGPFRRFTGGDPTLDEKDKISPITPYNTLFKPEIALTSTLAWIKDQHLRALEKDNQAGKVLEGIKALVNAGDLLPGGLSMDKITADGVFFKDADNTELHINDLSDGVKSVLSLTMEMIRLMLNKYSVEKVFGDFSSSKHISAAGVVLVDEIDAHLHPTWQTRIGQWLTQYFPKLQFIVTTHSPLICRACEKGSIWRLAAPGSNQKQGEVTGTQRDRLIYGNVLDAYGTEVFGAGTSRSAEGNEKLHRLAELNIKSIVGEISKKEEQEYIELQTIFPTGK